MAAAVTPDIFMPGSRMRILFLLGPSPLRPLEAYVLACTPGPSPGHEDVPDQAEQAALDAARRVLRSLIINTASAPEGKASAGANPCQYQGRALIQSQDWWKLILASCRPDQAIHVAASPGAAARAARLPSQEDFPAAAAQGLAGAWPDVLCRF